MNWARILILLCIFIEAGWMAFDGSQALVTGALITPKSGPRAGQLGPWHHLVERVGVNPQGTAMKLVFAIYGWIWLAIGLAFAMGKSWCWPAMIVAAACTLWFFPLGTLLSVIQLVLLGALRHRLGL
jgi:hypothetical protein